CKLPGIGEVFQTFCTALVIVPCSLTVSWVFYMMERIGESTENPFEGGPNDVPISNIARTIEIDLREMLDEQDLPPVIVPVNNILM
ncbi:MAG TPA: bestrophin family ion channel, partial [Chitinophagaceae bacterium]|nr:bestrophin family ion channel [Chitinophagaceae bacterium]